MSDKSKTRRVTQVPAIVGDDGYERHPSYGKIGISRVQSSGQVPLFGSDIFHGSFMRLTIKEARVERGEKTGLKESSGTHIYADAIVATVDMSQTQFAEMITNPNSGDGVPCTIHYVTGDTESWRAYTPPPKVKTEVFKKDIKTDAEGLLKTVREHQSWVQDVIDEGRQFNAAEKKRIVAENEAIMTLLTSTLPFRLEQFQEQMSNIVDTARQEINAYAQAKIHDAGIAALTGVKQTIVALDDRNAIDAEYTGGTTALPENAGGE